MTFKEEIYKGFEQLLQDKLGLLQQDLDGLFASAQNETKRTAGDKHETALAMLQLEQEKKRQQLSEARIQQSVLQRIDPLIIHHKVAPGALVKTSQGHFFISLALGKIMLKGIPVISLSPQSPLGSQLIGLTAGHELKLNGRTYLILQIS